MLEHWLAVLQRPPSTWSAGEVECWARTVPERHGAGMPWLATVLERNCIGEGGVLECNGKDEGDVGAMHQANNAFVPGIQTPNVLAQRHAGLSHGPLISLRMQTLASIIRLLCRWGPPLPAG